MLEGESFGTGQSTFWELRLGMVLMHLQGAPAAGGAAGVCPACACCAVSSADSVAQMHALCLRSASHK